MNLLFFVNNEKIIQTNYFLSVSTVFSAIPAFVSHSKTSAGKPAKKIMPLKKEVFLFYGTIEPYIEVDML